MNLEIAVFKYIETTSVLAMLDITMPGNTMRCLGHFGFLSQ